MTTGVQFTGTLGPNATQKWFTFNWNPAQHIIWTVVPIDAKNGAPEIQWSVAVERATRDNLHLLDHGDQSGQCHHYL